MAKEKQPEKPAEIVALILVKIWGTIVFEHIISGFENRKEAEKWQTEFDNTAPPEAYCTIVAISKYQEVPKITQELHQAIESYYHEFEI